MSPTLFTPIVILAGLIATRTSCIYWQMFFCLFGAASAIHLTAIGGSTITPGPLFLPFLLVRAWTEGRNESYFRKVPVAGVWLGMAVFSGLLTAYFVPRWFQGDVQIMTVDTTTGNFAAALYPLHPVSGNITQSGYALGGLLGFLAFRSLLNRPERVEHFRNAVLLLAALDALAAIINLAEFYLGFPPVLTYVRDAYALFDAYEEGGLMRIHGTFPETSAYTAFTLPLFAFSFQLWLHRVRPYYSGAVALVLVLMLLLSTSTTAYVGCALYALMFVFALTYRGYTRGTVPRLGLLIAGALLIAAMFGSLFALDTPFGQRMIDYFNLTVFHKLESSSGQSRSELNAYAWKNFLDTYGLGVGLGTPRASSLPLVLLANLGLVGTVCFLGFLFSVLRQPPSAASLRTAPNAAQEAARHGLMAALAAATVSAAVYDLGLVFYALAALASHKVSHAAPRATFTAAALGSLQPSSTRFSR